MARRTSRGRRVTQETFERAHEQQWAEFEALLDGARTGGSPLAFPKRYRAVCRDLALATERGFSALLVDRLNRLALRGHQRLYGTRGRRASLLEFFAMRFPAAVRAEGALFATACALFVGVGAVVFALGVADPALIYSLLDPDQVEEFEQMYDPGAAHYGTPRDTVGDFAAYAFYTSNNIGVALRVFAWGVFAGLGSLAVLVFNGIHLGIVAAHVTTLGHAEPFFSFVIGHGALELTAIALAGTTGMRLGWSLVAPGEWSRGAALRRAARGCVPLLYGAVAMLAAAAVIEAFWSSSRLVAPSVKLGVGAALWAFVGVWLGFGGRQRRAH